jgi:hypothetical protein
MWQSISASSVAVVLVVTAAGCAAAVEPPVPPAQPTREVSTMRSLESVTEAVLADAIQRTGVDKESLKVESAEDLTWADGSLGCPQPGMSYTMALVPGYRIRIKAAERVLNYHASARGYWLLCPVGRAVDPAPRDAI